MIKHSLYLKASGIYVIINTINNKKYVGQAYSLYNRYMNHKHGYSNAPKLTTAINKYGWENFQFTILELCAKPLLNEREEYWILFYETLNPEKGYNLIQRQDTKRIPCREETKKKISETFKKLFPEGRSGDKNPFFGKKHSEETRKLISQRRRESNFVPKTKIVIRIDKEGNETIFICFRLAAESVNGYASQIHTAINQNTPYKNYIWIKEEDKNKMTQEEFEAWKKSVCYPHKNF